MNGRDVGCEVTFDFFIRGTCNATTSHEIKVKTRREMCGGICLRELRKRIGEGEKGKRKREGNQVSNGAS